MFKRMAEGEEGRQREAGGEGAEVGGRRTMAHPEQGIHKVRRHHFGHSLQHVTESDSSRR